MPINGNNFENLFLPVGKYYLNRCNIAFTFYKVYRYLYGLVRLVTTGTVIQNVDENIY